LEVPIYEYQCDACEHKLEVLQKISDEALKECPECGQQDLRKLVSAAAFRLKGDGWYETDFKDKKEQKNLSKSDDKPQKESAAKKSAASGGKKSESISAAGSTDKKTTETKPVSVAASND